ncbi:putative ribonuclease H1/H2 small subunit, partial [Trypanosoma grayi]|uniref:putative ribonuclease H1/H2 small subunit n=1 Tax=Trypanosoma grayi TaxID=71804 RepID=UPI0004F48869
MPEQQQQGGVVVHSLPIKTTFRGTTDIDANFTQHTVRDESGELHNTLRGRTLIGREVVLPPTYALVCASLAKRQQTQGAAGQSVAALVQVEATASDVHVSAATDRFCLWEHDKRPERPAALLQWLG